MSLELSLELILPHIDEDISMRGGARTGAGRKPLDIDLEQLEKLASLQCTDRELAAFFRCTTRTIEKRRKEPAFKEALERGRAMGQISVRRAQMKVARSW